jgi:DNA-binding NtrC family response regulator
MRESTLRENGYRGGDGLYLVALLDDGAVVRGLPAGRSITVGSGANADLTIDRPGLSAAHFAVRAGIVPLVRDLTSAGGTYMGERRLGAGVDTPVDLGTLIKAGGAFFVLRDRDLDVSRAERDANDEPDVRWASSAVVVEDPAMADLHRLVALVAGSSMPVIVTGETGVGKEIVATALHARSPRRRKEIVRVNCAALPEALLESELFGFERAAFTGATRSKPGLIESADGSTFFLDEVGELPVATQAKLLRVLESGEVTRLGALAPRSVDVRFVAATNRNLPALVAARSFRADLYYRLNGITIGVPPLRDRIREIRKIAAFFLAEGAQRAQRAAPRLSDAAAATLERHHWPGNVRELRSVMERALVTCRGDVVGEEHVLIDAAEPLQDSQELEAQHGASSSAVPRTQPSERSARGRLVRPDRETERALIQQALDEAGGHQGRAAALLGVSRRTLIHRLDEHGLARPRKR